MKFPESDSWYFEATDARALDVAIYVRDALRLGVMDTRRNPPSLGPTVPDRRSLMTARLLDLAAPAWSDWWDVLLEEATRPRDPDSAPLFAIWEPVENSILRRPFIRLRDEASRWINDRPADRDLGIPWDLMSDVAHEVAFDRDVPIGQVHGLVRAISAPGAWWYRPGPGVVICSWEAPHTPELARLIVRAALDPDMAL